MLARDTFTLVVQVNGRVRAKIEAESGLDDDELLALARADAHVSEQLDGRDVIKEIVVPGRLVNLVVR